MTVERDPRTRIVLSWLREEAHENAERVLLRALDEVDATPQRRSWWPARRSMHMNPAYKVALTTAAVLVAAVVGFNLLPRSPGPGNPTPPPSAQSSLSPTSSPASSAESVPPMPPPGGRLAPGRYSIPIPDSDVRAAVTVEDGWTSGENLIMNPPAYTKVVTFWTVANVYDDICDPATGGPPTASQLPNPAVGPTVDDLVAALDAQVNSDMSSPLDVSVGGYTGKRVTMIISEPYDHCFGDSEFRAVWVDPRGTPRRGLQPGDPDTYWIVDVAGRRVVIITNDAEVDPDGPASIAAVIDSIDFEVP